MGGEGKGDLTSPRTNKSTTHSPSHSSVSATPSRSSAPPVPTNSSSGRFPTTGKWEGWASSTGLFSGCSLFVSTSGFDRLFPTWRRPGSTGVLRGRMIPTLRTAQSILLRSGKRSK